LDTQQENTQVKHYNCCCYRHIQRERQKNHLENANLVIKKTRLSCDIFSSHGGKLVIFEAWILHHRGCHGYQDSSLKQRNLERTEKKRLSVERERERVIKYFCFCLYLFSLLVAEDRKWWAWGYCFLAGLYSVLDTSCSSRKMIFFLGFRHEQSYNNRLAHDLCKLNR